MGLTKTVVVLIALICIAVTPIYAGWEGPSEIISGVWGSGDNQFGIEYGDSHDLFPGFIDVSKVGLIVISDGINGRFKLFSHSGQLLSNVVPPLDNPKDWVIKPKFVDSNIVLITNKYFFFSASGSLIATVDTMGGISFWDTINDRLYVQIKTSNQWLSYSSTGQLIKTSTTRPAELGLMKSEKLAEKKYKITMTYADTVYSLLSDRRFTKHTRDLSNHVYGINPGGVLRFNQCGRMEGRLSIPRDESHTVPRESGSGEPLVTVNAEYGEPVVAPNGDVYTWKRTPDKYVILKWTWVDDPNIPTGPDAPSALSVIASTKGLYLTWGASPGDPGCVTAYEISRATSAGGAGTTVGTVPAGTVTYNDSSAVAGTTYYYKVQAKAGSEYSPYTAEVSGKK